VSLFRRSPPPPEPRRPHPDGRVEAQLQRVLSLYSAVDRTAARIGSITSEQEKLDDKIRASAGYGVTTGHLHAQARELRAERTRLEAFISARHEEITELLTELGEDAAFLGGF
jgi:hypothetical protein